MLKHLSAAAMRLRSAFVLGIVLTMVPVAAEARLEGRARAALLDDNFGKCMRAGARHPAAGDLPPSILTKICTCSANFVADRLTPQDAAIAMYGNRAEKRPMWQKVDALSDSGLRTCIRSRKAS